MTEKSVSTEENWRSRGTFINSLDTVSRSGLYFGIDWGKLGYFHYTLWTRFRVPNRKNSTIQGDREIGIKIGDQGVLSLYSLDAVSRSEYFPKG